MLPLKDNDSIPNLIVRVFGNWHKYLFVGRISQPFLHEIPKAMRGSSYSLLSKFRSSVSGDFEHVSSHFHFLQ